MKLGRFVVLCFLAVVSLKSAAFAEDAFVLKILSYNVHGLPGFLAPNQGRYKKIGEILAKRRAEGNAPHIVAIQEAFARGTKDIIRTAGFPYVKAGPAKAALKMSGGLYILSEFPILESSTLTYKQCVSWDCFANKGAQHVRVHPDGVPVPLDIYNTHMNSDPDTDFFAQVKQTRETRIAQTGQFLPFMMKTLAERSMVFMPGDFNFISGQVDYNYFAFLSGLLHSGHRCVEDHACNGWDKATVDLVNTVDHQFYATRSSSGMRVTPIHYERNFEEEADGRLLSDHSGLEVHYRISW